MYILINLDIRLKYDKQTVYLSAGGFNINCPSKRHGSIKPSPAISSNFGLKQIKHEQ